MSRSPYLRHDQLVGITEMNGWVNHQDLRDNLGCGVPIFPSCKSSTSRTTWLGGIRSQTWSNEVQSDGFGGPRAIQPIHD